MIHSPLKRRVIKQPNGLRYLRVDGRGQCLGAGKTRSQKMLENAAESHTSGARFVGQPCTKDYLIYSYVQR